MLQLIGRANKILTVLDVRWLNNEASPFLLETAKEFFHGDIKQTIYALQQVAVDVAAIEQKRGGPFHPKQLKETVRAEIIDFMAFDRELRAREGKKRHLNLAGPVAPYEPAIEKRANNMLLLLEKHDPDAFSEMLNAVTDIYAEGDSKKARELLHHAALEIAVNEGQLKREFPLHDIVNHLSYELYQHAEIQMDLAATDPTNAERRIIESTQKEVNYYLQALSKEDKRMLCRKLKPLGGNPLDQLHDSMLMLLDQYNGKDLPIHKAEDVFPLLDKLIEGRLHLERNDGPLLPH